MKADHVKMKSCSIFGKQKKTFGARLSEDLKIYFRRVHKLLNSGRRSLTELSYLSWNKMKFRSCESDTR